MNNRAQSIVKSSSTPSFSPAPVNMVQRKCACGGSADLNGECAECRKKKLLGENAPMMQTKLKINRPNDKYEQEADRVADEVMRMPSPMVQRQTGVEETEDEETIQTIPIAGKITPMVQRQATDPQEEEEETLLQTKTVGDRTFETTPAIDPGMTSKQHGGRPLSIPERRFFEPRFGADFSNVRVHHDTLAANTARSVNARAFTLGNNIVFGGGEYLQNSFSGMKLLAHELTHTIQQRQRNGIVQRAALDCQSVSPRSNCIDTPETEKFSTVESVLREARQHAGRIANIVQRNRGDMEGVGMLNKEMLPAFEQFFGDWRDPSIVNNVSTRLDTLVRHLNQMGQSHSGTTPKIPLGCANSCDKSCGTGALAMYDPDPKVKSIFFCDPWFKKKADHQLATLLHEAVHASMTDDFDVYNQTRLFKLAKSETAPPIPMFPPGFRPQGIPPISGKPLSLKNPDSFAGFILASQGVISSASSAIAATAPEDKMVRFKDNANETLAVQRAIAVAELVIKKGEDSVEKLIFVLDKGFRPRETWGQIIHRRPKIANQRNTVHFLRGPSPGPPDINTRCTSPAHFNFQCPVNNKTPGSDDLSKAREIEANLEILRSHLGNPFRIAKRKRGPAFVFREGLGILYKINVSDTFFDNISQRGQWVLVIDSLMKFKKTPNKRQYRRFLMHNAQEMIGDHIQLD